MFDFKKVALEDRSFLEDFFWGYQPETSELNFTNLFIWQEHYNFQWAVFKEWLFMVGKNQDGVWWALPPVGEGPRTAPVHLLLSYLKEEKGVSRPFIDRADMKLVEELAGNGSFRIVPKRDHFDYIYLTKDLIELSGRKYHSKKNHVNSFRKSYDFRFEVLGESHSFRCMSLTDEWCQLKRCEDDLNLKGEWEAVRRCFENYSSLGVMGGVILSGEEVLGFSIGEKLNDTTAVIHIEKAQPDIKGSYAVINQQCCEKLWSSCEFVNREQDLGDESLRRAKLSYHPTKFSEKYMISLYD